MLELFISLIIGFGAGLSIGEFVIRPLIKRLYFHIHYTGKYIKSDGDTYNDKHR